MPIITWRSFSSCQPWTRNVFNSSRRTGLQTVWVFHVNPFLHFRSWRGYLFWVRFSCVFHFFPQSHGVPWHACTEKSNCLHLNKIHLSSAENTPVFRSASEFCPLPRVTSLCVNFCSEIHNSALKFCLVKELQMHFRVEITRNCHA